MELLIAILTAYGVTNIVTHGAIFDSFREWLGTKAVGNRLYKFLFKMVNCPMCFGFWVGILVGAICGPFPALHVIFNGALYSGTTWIIFCVTQFLGQGYDPARTVNVQFHNTLDINTTKADQPPTPGT